eukprot:GHVT01007779.1.p1 GENE.GHVT01007779.1~~GHVT01007779.1.p1  ORF type:complete len:319 (+),score=46.61 GHVT01007779.1:165-1121(+)
MMMYGASGGRMTAGGQGLVGGGMMASSSGLRGPRTLRGSASCSALPRVGANGRTCRYPRLSASRMMRLVEIKEREDAKAGLTGNIIERYGDSPDNLMAAQQRIKTMINSKAARTQQSRQGPRPITVDSRAQYGMMRGSAPPLPQLQRKQPQSSHTGANCSNTQQAQRRSRQSITSASDHTLAPGNCPVPPASSNAVGAATTLPLMNGESKSCGRTTTVALPVSADDVALATVQRMSSAATTAATVSSSADRGGDGRSTLLQQDEPLLFDWAAIDAHAAWLFEEEQQAERTMKKEQQFKLQQDLDQQLKEKRCLLKTHT